MRISNFKFQIWIVILIVVLPGLPKQALASSFDLAVSPPIFQIELTPPALASVKEQLVLENKGDDPLDLTLVFRSFKPKGDNGEALYLQTGEVIGSDPLIFQRISVLLDGKRIESLHLPPKTKRSLDLAVSIPKDEPPGDYYFTILFAKEETATPAANLEPQGSLSKSIGGIGVNVLLSIGPKGKTKGAIQQFSTDFFQTEGPVPFIVKIKNNSQHFIYPTANIVIKNMFGQIIGKVKLLPVNILSNSSRALPSREQFVFAASKGNEESKDNAHLQEIIMRSLSGNQPLAIWPERFLFGPYNASLTVALSDEGPLYVRSLTFIGFPIHIILGFIVAIGIILIIRSRLKQRKT